MLLVYSTPWHTVVFWLGFVCDTIGTGAMGKLAGWASIVLIRKNERLILQFHKFSFVVWIIWLIPMVTGMLLGSDF